ncbi:TlpA disulfide reductase family protein [Marinomonas transparens]|uniref:TlpA family protein disulfide reductase n=1 Tax=Marinomonas transparens TaxID=2795388 RepID=A0A934N348_9GAMM|nr:TlpA disulfide reductase family protein [Marinomonas transparens]MBJ7539362.1 TlpA family protein disulfide reductase [Marinomonas transparens]
MKDVMILAFRFTFTCLLFAVSLSTSTLAANTLAPNKLAPPIKGLEIHQQTDIALSDYLGKVTLLDFWASWCAPCRQSLPQLNRLRNQFNNKGFEIIAVNLDENTKDAKTFLEQYPVQYPILTKASQSQIQAYEIEGLPVSYLIGKDGKIITRFVGFKKRHLKEIERYLLDETFARSHEQNRDKAKTDEKAEFMGYK